MVVTSPNAARRIRRVTMLTATALPFHLAALVRIISRMILPVLAPQVPVPHPIAVRQIRRATTLMVAALTFLRAALVRIISRMILLACAPLACALLQTAATRNLKLLLKLLLPVVL